MIHTGQWEIRQSNWAISAFEIPGQSTFFFSECQGNGPILNNQPIFHKCCTLANVVWCNNFSIFCGILCNEALVHFKHVVVNIVCLVPTLRMQPDYGILNSFNHKAEKPVYYNCINVPYTIEIVQMNYSAKENSFNWTHLKGTICLSVLSFFLWFWLYDVE